MAAASRSPAVSSVHPVSDAQLDKGNKAVGELMTALLTQRCRDQAQKAIQYEGQTTIEMSFSVLGQVAARELFSSPEVAAGMSGLKKYVDADKIKALVTAK